MSFWTSKGSLTFSEVVLEVVLFLPQVGANCLNTFNRTRSSLTQSFCRRMYCPCSAPTVHGCHSIPFIPMPDPFLMMGSIIWDLWEVGCLGFWEPLIYYYMAIILAMEMADTSGSGKTEVQKDIHNLKRGTLPLKRTTSLKDPFPSPSGSQLSKYLQPCPKSFTLTCPCSAPTAHGCHLAYLLLYMVHTHGGLHHLGYAGGWLSRVRSSE